VKNMAKTVSVTITDDLDGSPGAGAMAFSFEGHSYEIDLSAANQAKLEKALQPFITAGRRTTHRKPQQQAARTTPLRVDRAAVRAWAAEHGLQVSDRGRISAEVMSKYEAAH
jgi:Lsr2